MAASLLCAPVVYPWYLLWLLPFLRSALDAANHHLDGQRFIPTYYVWHLRKLGRPWVVPGWIMLLEYGSVAAAAAIIGWRRSTRAASVRSFQAVEGAIRLAFWPLSSVSRLQPTTEGIGRANGAGFLPREKLVVTRR